ncbi:MAG: membrane protein insertion efficiency factor YidD [Bacteroidota bacterium]
MIRKIIIFPFVILLKFYKLAISPLLPASCRHIPTCSEYAIEALRIHGLIKGSWLAMRRLSKCHPWGTHGYDPVPKVRIKEIEKSKYL